MTAYLSEAEVAELVSLAEVIDAVQDAVERETTGQAANIAKTMTAWGPASSGHALGAVDTTSGLLAFKTWVNTPVGASAVLTLFDIATGQLLATMAAGTLGALRTAAITGLATRLLADIQADDLAILGSGRQALRQVEAVNLVRPLRRVRVWSPDAERRAAFARTVGDTLGITTVVTDSVEEATREAPIITTVTRAREPFLRREHLAAGAHLNAVGAILPANAEFAPNLLADAGLVAVDNLDNARRSSRELREFFGEDFSTVRTLGELAVGTAARPIGSAPTVFKGLGMGLSDLAAATVVARRIGLERTATL
ncbi:ornithine cyclodeaminase family protein [Nocardia arthritidis]|uniref:ornithine cyclodeaminase family protein n=1 Tax=Nocardia arthritidis TaxID=228602 RepID=UPI0007A393EB|nr:ornithine cyclodeaminase family protein [Nocardia arthritidis]